MNGGAEELGGVDAAAGSSYGEGEVTALKGFWHGMIIADVGTPSPLSPAHKAPVFREIDEGASAKILQTKGLRAKYSK